VAGGKRSTAPLAATAIGTTNAIASGNSASKDAFEAEALKLKQDLQSMQTALNDRMNRYRR
jgi:hypothetical protein